MATMNDYGLTDAGFRRPTYTELLDAIERQARDAFGPTANLTVRSPLGMFLRIFTWALNLLFSTLEHVYNSRFIDTSVGHSLYNLGRAIGLQLLPAQKASGYLLVSGTPGVIVPAGWLVGSPTNIQYVVLEAGTIGADGTVSVLAQATTSGPEGNAGAETITDIINPATPSGITSVTNPRAFDGGRDRETDEEYRNRYYQSVDFAGGVNADGIRGEILQNVEGVYSAVIYENDTDYTDENNLPPHSFEAVVYGGIDQDVAAAIFRRKAAGIQTYGNTMIPILSDSSVVYDVHFSRPDPVPVWVRVEHLATDDSKFPADGMDQVRDAIISYIGGDARDGLSIGENVIYNRIPCRVLSVSGVIDFTLEISGDGYNYGHENIPIGTRQKAVTDAEKVEVS